MEKKAGNVIRLEMSNKDWKRDAGRQREQNKCNFTDQFN